jgi:hypothetical protein
MKRRHQAETTAIKANQPHGMSAFWTGQKLAATAAEV